MSLHESLVALANHATICESEAEARGVLAESDELLRNGIEHGSRFTELVEWFSSVRIGVLVSPAIHALAGARPRPTGAIARGDALPQSPVHWLATADLHHERLTAFFASLGIEAGPVEPTAVDRADAGVGELTTEDIAQLWQRVTAHRPPPLANTASGLPDPEQTVSVTRLLLLPIADIARWAAGSQAASIMATSRRLEVGVSTGSLREGEYEDLVRTRETGCRLALDRWRTHSADSDVPWSYMPALQRSAYGESARLVGAIIRAIAAETANAETATATSTTETTTATADPEREDVNGR